LGCRKHDPARCVGVGTGGGPIDDLIRARARLIVDFIRARREVMAGRRLHRHRLSGCRGWKGQGLWRRHSDWRLGCNVVEVPETGP